MISIDSELVRLLMRTGYLAAWNGFHKEAVAIFDGVAAVRPESDIPLIGGAVVAILTGNLEMAASTLDGALAINPDSAMALAHQGCVLRLQGREDEGLEILRSVEAQTEDVEAAAMARNVLTLDADQLKPNFNPQ